MSNQFNIIIPLRLSPSLSHIYAHSVSHNCVFPHPLQEFGQRMTQIIHSMKTHTCNRAEQTSDTEDKLLAALTSNLRACPQSVTSPGGT